MRDSTVVALLALFILVLALAQAAQAQDTMLLCWATPTENDDGTPLAAEDILVYRLFSVDQGDVDFQTAVGGHVNCMNVAKGCYALRTRDVNGVESVEYSEAICANGDTCHLDPEL